MTFEVSRYLDKRYLTKAGSFPVTIRIYHNRKNDDVKTGINLTEEEFHLLCLPKVKPYLKSSLSAIIQVESLVRSYLESGREYCIKQLRAYIKSPVQEPTLKAEINPISSDNVFDWFNHKIVELKKNNQLGSAESYESTKNVYQKVFKSSHLPFDFFSVAKLKELEVDLLQNRGIEISTVGKHARNLRSIFKLAKVTNELYPFGRYKYMIPEVTKAKKALSRQDLKSLIKYLPQTYHEKRALSFFVFAYYANGMNFKDIAMLKYKDLRNDILHYYRKKTKSTNSTLKIIKVIVTEEMRHVIAEFGSQNVVPEAYIFPILQRGMTENEIKAKVKTRNKSINKTLSIIVRKLGLGGAVTLGMSRHSFANALKQEGVSISFIQEALGHGSPSVTEHYLSSFEDAVSAEHINKLRSYFE